MVKGYNREINRILIYSVSLAIITLIYLYFGNFWEFMSTISFLNTNIVVPVTDSVNSWGGIAIAGLNLSGKGIIITLLLSSGLIIAIILLYLIARQILKIIKF